MQSTFMQVIINTAQKHAPLVFDENANIVAKCKKLDVGLLVVMI